MLARLGQVLYWAGCIIGGLLAMLAISFQFTGGSDRWFLMALFGGIAVVVWAIGRACKYVLAGE